MSKVYVKSKENQTIIKALSMYGRVPEQWELLNEIDRLNNAFDELEEYIKFQRKISLSLKNGYGVSLCDKFLDKLNELRNK